MKREVSVERLYYLGDYKNIKMGSTTTEIPEELALNNNAVELIFVQQYLACEIAYRKYIDMIDKINQEFSVEIRGKKVADAQKVMEFLQEQRTQTLQELLQEAKQTKQEKGLQKDES